MKIGFIGDVHFGGGFNIGKTDETTQLNTRLIDFSNTFNSIVDRFCEAGVSLAIVVGDIFDTRSPSPSQLSIFSKCVKRAVDKKLKVVMFAGNHDQQRVISTTTIDFFDSLKIDGVSVYTDFAIYSDKENDVDIVILPFKDRRMLGVLSNKEALEKINESVDRLLDKCHCSKKILTGHMMLDGMSLSSVEVNDVMLERSMLDKFDFVLMGHIHSFGIINEQNPPIIHIGSMERSSFGDKGDKCSLILDTDDFKYVIFKQNVREMFELNLDYSSQDPYKKQIMDKIDNEIEKFCNENDVKDSIFKFVLKVRDIDMNHVEQDKIRQNILSRGVHVLVPLQISAISSRNMRNDTITEIANEKTAMVDFINGLAENEEIKKKLIKYAENIIDEVDNK